MANIIKAIVYTGGTAAGEERASIRDSSYCEITPIFLVPTALPADLLDGYPRPTGWTYSTRILKRELVLDSTGVVTVLTFRGSVPLSTWEKR